MILLKLLAITLISLEQNHFGIKITLKLWLFFLHHFGISFILLWYHFYCIILTLLCYYLNIILTNNILVAIDCYNVIILIWLQSKIPLIILINMYILYFTLILHHYNATPSVSIMPIDTMLQNYVKITYT